MNNILAFHKSVQGANHIAWAGPVRMLPVLMRTRKSTTMWLWFRMDMAQMNATVPTKVQRSQ